MAFLIKALKNEKCSINIFEKPHNERCAIMELLKL